MVPPVDALYQSIVDPTTGVAKIVAIPVPHIETSVAAGAEGTALMVAVTATREEEAQPVVVFLA